MTNPVQRLYLCGFPKSGLHMLEQAASSFVRQTDEKNWAGTSAWDDKITNLEKFLKSIAAIPKGAYAKGHAAHHRTIEEFFQAQGIGVVFIYRDLRDVVVSQTNHILNVDDAKLKHPGAELYRGLEYEDILISIIEGKDKYNGIFERFELYIGWINSGWVHKIRYEDLRLREKQTCTKLYEYTLNLAGLTATNEFKTRVANDMTRRVRDRRRSVTFNKGKVGGWKKAFTKKVIDCFKANDPGWLVELGYAKDNNW